MTNILLQLEPCARCLSTHRLPPLALLPQLNLDGDEGRVLQVVEHVTLTFNACRQRIEIISFGVRILLKIRINIRESGGQIRHWIADFH